MKKVLLPILAVTAASPATFGLVNLGEGQIDLDVQLSAYYDTEIRARDLGQEDWVFSLRPSLVYTRSSKNLDFSASVGLNSVSYLDFSEFDDTDFFFDLNIAPSAQMETSRFVFSGDLILNTETTSEGSVGEIVTINNYGGSAQLIYDPNRHYTITGSVDYRERDPDTAIYFKTKTFDSSLSLAVPVNEAISVNGGISYLDTSTDGSVDSETFTYFAGLEGNIGPKLNGSISGGFQNRDFDSGASDDSPFFSANLDYEVDERSSLSLTGSQQFGTTIDDRSTETFSIRLSGRRSLSRELSAAAYIGYETDDYSTIDPIDPVGTVQDREDKSTLLGASLKYQLVQWGSVELDLSYRDQSSDEEEFDYDRFRAGIRFNGTW